MRLLLLVAAVVSHSPYIAQKVTSAKSESPSGLVSLSERVHRAVKEQDHCPTKPSTLTPLQGSLPDRKDGDDRQWTVEMQCVPTNGKGHIGVLLPLRQALEQSMGQLLCPSTRWRWSQSNLGGEITQVTCSGPMARAPTAECQQKDEEKERWWQDWWKRRKQGKGQAGWHYAWRSFCRTHPGYATTPGRPDFLSSWQAVEVASDLSRELGFAPTVPMVCPSSNGLVEKAVLHRPGGTSKKVRFCDSICLRMTSQVADADYLVPHSALGHWCNKPWTLTSTSLASALDADWDDAMLMQTSLDSPRQSVPHVCSEPRDFLSDDIRSLVSLLQSPSSSRRFVSHGLAETSVGSRSFVLLDPNPDGLISQVRALWPEYDDGVLRLHAVWPQPSDAVANHHIIAEFLIGGELPHHSIEPVLEESVVWSAFGQTDMQRHALYHQRRLCHADVMGPYSDLCHRAHFVCTVRVLGRILPLDWTRNIVPYIQGLPTFFVDALGMLGESIVPTPVWRFHLLLADGYRGVAESTVPIANVASPSAIADCAFSHWNMELPGSLVYAGLPFPESVVQNFIAYETDFEGVPCLIEVVCDESLGLPAPPQVAAFVSSVCTLQQLVSATNALWIFELVGVSLTVSDGFVTYDSDDRFRPRAGAFFSINVRAETSDGSSLLQLSQSLRKRSGGAPEQKDPRRASHFGAFPESIQESIQFTRSKAQSSSTASFYWLRPIPSFCPCRART